jgi:predicted MPP superfamily phosphohydrolase
VSKTLSMILFFVMFFAILGVVHLYLWIRLVRDPVLPQPWRRVATIAIVVLGASVPLTFFLGRALPFSVHRWTSLVPFAWLGVMMLFLFWFAAGDVLKLLGTIGTRATGNGPLLADPGRRQALGRILAGGAACFVAPATGFALFRATRRPEVVRRVFELDRFPAALNGFRIVQISDLHVGIQVGREWVQRLVERVNGMDPDLIAITGDLIDGTVDTLRDEVAPLADLRAKHGVFFITGNHEYYFDAVAWCAHVESLGIRVLRNEHVAIGRGRDSFYVAGVDDESSRGMAPGHGPDVEKALAGRDPSFATVLLAHQPRTIPDAVDRDVGLVLAGHTHGGQIWPFPYLVRLSTPYVRGTYRHESGMHIHVNEGTGVWGPPMRLGTRSEITEIELRAR